MRDVSYFFIRLRLVSTNKDKSYMKRISPVELMIYYKEPVNYTYLLT